MCFSALPSGLPHLSPSTAGSGEAGAAATTASVPNHDGRGSQAVTSGATSSLPGRGLALSLTVLLGGLDGQCLHFVLGELQPPMHVTTT